MRRVGFGALLIGLNTGLVLLAVVCVAVAAVRLLDRLADQQALARVGLAGASARQAVERSGSDVLTSAHLLAERPTAARLLGQGDAAGLTAFLDRFRATSRLSGCAVLVGGRPAAVSGAPHPWAELLRQAAAGKPSLVRAPDGGLLYAAAVPLVFAPGATAVAVLDLDQSFVRQISRQVRVPVAIVAVADQNDADDPRAALRGRALGANTEVEEKVRGEAGAAYVAALPLGPAAVVEATLDAGPVAASLARVQRALFAAALLVAALASLSGLLISRRLTGPVRSLTSAAARLGRGDLATPVPRVEGAELGSLAATMEETRRRLLRLTSELHRRQAESEAVLTGISEGVYSVDRDRRIRYLNPQAAQLLGVRPEEALGRFCGDVLRPAAPGGVRPCEQDCPILHARFRGATRATERLRQQDGSERVVVLASAPPTDDLQFQVISDETEAEAARRLRDAVLANISHEFKTPLAAQRASIELLRERLLEEGAAVAPGETQGLVLSLERGGLRLTQLIDNLLESVRIEAGETSLRHRPVALDEVVEEAVEMTAPLLEQRGQAIETDLPYPLPEIDGDAPRLTQVFVNLLANANKFAPAHSTVRIGGAVEESAVRLWVEDEGPGLSSPVGEGGSLFERFVRAPGRGEEPEQSGMGLGLWIVQSIVERHGGTVEAMAANAGPGGGTRIRITLPRPAPEETRRPA